MTTNLKNRKLIASIKELTFMIGSFPKDRYKINISGALQLNHSTIFSSWNVSKYILCVLCSKSNIFKEKIFFDKYTNFFICFLLSDICFQFLDIWNKATMNRTKLISVWLTGASFGYIPKRYINFQFSQEPSY